MAVARSFSLSNSSLSLSSSLFSSRPSHVIGIQQTQFLNTHPLCALIPRHYHFQSVTRVLQKVAISDIWGFIQFLRYWPDTGVLRVPALHRIWFVTACVDSRSSQEDASFVYPWQAVCDLFVSCLSSLNKMSNASLSDPLQPSR
mgnify:CR=1 FL=1